MTEVQDETKIALINNNIQYIQKDISEIKSSVDKLSGVYITRGQFDSAMKARDEKIDGLMRATNFWRFASPFIASVIVAAFEFLLINYIQHLK